VRLSSNKTCSLGIRKYLIQKYAKYASHVFDDHYGFRYRHYLKTWFTIDVLSTIPFDLIYFAVDDLVEKDKHSYFRYFRLLELLKILRLARVVRYLKKIQQVHKDLITPKRSLILRQATK
jgi:hypothetical protein